MSRRRPLRLLPFVLAACVFGASAAQARAHRASRADDAVLTSATREWKALSADLRKRQHRDRWEKLIRRFEAIGHSKASTSMQALALYRAGLAASEMSSISHLRKDAKRAEALFLEAGQLKTSTAADALNAAAEIEQERLGMPARARDTRALAKAVGRHEAEPVAKAVPKDDGEPAQLRSATEAWRRLEEDPSKRRLREPWLTVISRLEATGEALAPEHAGALGYYRAAKAAEELHKESYLKADVRRAVSLYETVAARCPKSSLADDALLAAAELEKGSLQDVEGARKDLKQAIGLGGDRTGEAQRFLGTLPTETAKPAATEAETTAAFADAIDPATAATPQTTDEEVDEGPGLTTAAAGTATVSEPELKRMRKLALADTTISLSEQAGLKIKRIVIDAGHGGKDDGATGPHGIHEKDVTLAMARVLATTLKARGYDVVLTRNSDDFIALEERTSIANRVRGDLFISIHANASPSHKQSGIETYALNVASNRFAMRLAARENATSTRRVSDLDYLLADLATRANTIDSDRFATYVQSSVVSRLGRKYSRPKDLGVKHALFFVLLGAKMPAILVETGFISNPTEEKRLASTAYQSAVAESIAHAVDQFVARRRQVASAVP